MLTDAVAAMLLETDNSDILPCSRQGIKLKRKKAGDPAYGGGANSGAKARKKSKSASGPSATIPPSSIVEVQHPTAPPPLYLLPPSSIVEVLHPTAPPPLYLLAHSTAYDLSMSTTTLSLFAHTTPYCTSCPVFTNTVDGTGAFFVPFDPCSGSGALE
ncbi:hypothetical protein B0H14DRAFT_2651335 [Mycena olivaceomarginata]|nr:hypothetical protein B0H14DRAFT_2651335 [Mycena olivaceomarginata]